MMHRAAAAATLCSLAAGGSFDSVPTTLHASSATGCGGPHLGIRGDAKRLPTGTLYVNDKSHGFGWLVALETRKSLSVELQFPTGNHEAALSNDKSTMAAPWYETMAFNTTEGGGTPGYAATLIDLNSGATRVPAGGPSPFGSTKPHGPAWTHDGDLLLTQQLQNGIVRLDLKHDRVTPYPLIGTGCHTPHLIRVVPNSTLAVTGCRNSNDGHAPGNPGMAAVFDLETGEAKAMPGASWDEGIAVTDEGDVWVAAMKSNLVFVFGFGGRPRTVGNFELIAQHSVFSPLRLAFDSVTNTVAVASLDQAAAAERLKSRKSFEEPVPVDNSPNLWSFDATSRKLLRQTAVATSQRGQINLESLEAGDGFIFAPGYDSQAVAILDAKSLEVVMEVYYPLCSAPEGLCTPTFQTNWETAKAEGDAGWNNWSGGTCPATMRNQWDRRVVVLDGPVWSPLTYSWAKAKDESTLVV